MKEACIICGAREDTASAGGVTLCRRCLCALYAALDSHFPLKPEGECGTIDPSEIKAKTGD